MNKRANVAAVVVAAGRGERAGNAQEGPKQYRRIGGVSVLRRTLTALLGSGLVGRIVVAIHREDEAFYAKATAGLPDIVSFVHGGASRQASTLLALEALEENPPDIVLIHDGVRPFIDTDLIRRVVEMTTTGVGALPALPVSDTLKSADSDGRIVETVPRAGLHAAQTPQGFPYRPIYAAHKRAGREGRDDFTDDAAIAEWAGLTVKIVEGSVDNVKLTWARDIALADERLGGASFLPDVRVGNGYDVHCFGTGDAVYLCGVEIPHTRKLSGHSDADVGLHALTDALLATCGAGDIGTHFPPSEARWKGARSELFVRHAVETVRKAKGTIANVDITMICEAPKIGPHRSAMTAAIAAMTGLKPHRISIKATTNERLGFVGREEGIAAIATASVVYPGSLEIGDGE